MNTLKDKKIIVTGGAGFLGSKVFEKYRILEDLLYETCLSACLIGQIFLSTSLVS